MAIPKLLCLNRSYRIGHPTAVVLAVIAVISMHLSGCAANYGATPLAKYVPPPIGSPAAELHNTSLAATSLKGIGGRASTLDGAEPPKFANSVRVAPGSHRVGIDCLFNGTFFGDWFGRNYMQHVFVTGTFTTGQLYYIRCAVDAGVARTWLSDSPDGSALPPGFESQCTSGCEGGQ
jgi:hypothetical protein